MKQFPAQKPGALSIVFAIIATLIWSGNFIIARGIIHNITPCSLAFFRWLTATLIIAPFGWKRLAPALDIIYQRKGYFFFTALTGVTLFNSLVYIAGRYTTATNLALINTTASPVFVIILARIFLNEKITWQRLTGLALCIAGILFLLSKGNPANIFNMRFSTGDIWALFAALIFATYNVLARKKPAAISNIPFLAVIFLIGTFMLFPFFIVEQYLYAPVQMSMSLFWVIIYLGLGASVIAFLCWNKSIETIGAARTSLFGNLIPVFSMAEATFFLHEQIYWMHIFSFIVIVAGLIIANLRR